jgi:hypothetical protein
MNNPLLTTLEITAALCVRPSTAAELQAAFGDIGIATLKRHIAEARQLGADIESVKSGKSWLYQVKNPDAIRLRLKRWIELEKTRDLTC